MSDAESFLRIAGRLNALTERLNTLSTFGHRTASVAPYWSLAGLRAAWPMSSVNYANPMAADVSGNGYGLDNINSADFGNDGAAPYAQFDGVNQYLRRVDGGAANWADITGGEGYIVAAQQGLTLGGWFCFDRLTNSEFLMGKGTGAPPASSYWLIFRGDLANDPIRLTISNGAATDQVGVQITPATGTWTFVAGRYEPSTEIKVYAGQGGAAPLTTNTNAVGIPAALNDSASDFTIGSISGGGNYLDGRASFCFLCAAMLSDTMITALYSQTRALFGV